MKKQLSILAIFAAILLAALAASPVAANNGKGEVIGVTGIVPGKDLIVHVIVLVRPGADRSQVAKEALANQGARAMTKEEFSTIDLHWDQFFDDDANNDFVIQNYNPADDPTSSGGLVALIASQVIWTDVGSSNFVYQSGDTDITRCPSLVKECKGPQFFDGLNDVAWLSLKGRNTLGVTWSGTSTDEADMALNTNFNWTTDGSDYDIQTVYTHENGHALGLGHSDVSGAVMEATYAGERRVLDDDDKDGITFLYPVGSAPVVTISSPLDGAEITSGSSIDLLASATDADDDDNTLDIVWSSDPAGVPAGGGTGVLLDDGTYTITASVTDSDSQTSTDSVSILVGPPPDEATTVGVTGFSYSTAGGKDGDKNLRITVSVADDLEADVGSAAVSIKLTNTTTGGSWYGTANTGTDGTVTFQLRNAPAGFYSTVVTGISADGLPWDGDDGSSVDLGFDKSSGKLGKGDSASLVAE